MGLSASQGRLLLLTAKKSDLEFRAQQIAMLRSILCQQQEAASKEYEDATSNRIMDITLIAAVDSDVTASRSTKNLTYQTLISGTVTNNIDSSITGIVSSKKANTDIYEYTSAQMYRLTTPDGAIVVSDASEIPTSKKYTSTTDSPAGNHKTKFGSDGGASYTITKEKADGTTELSYGIVAPEGSELAKLLKGDNKSLGGFQVDSAKGWVKYTNDDDEVEYYSIATGKKATDDNPLPEGAKFSDENVATLYKTEGNVPASTKETETIAERFFETPGPDGITTLYETIEGKKVPVQRYLIDPNLGKNYYDSQSGLGDINYMQDCLRNGRYMLQRCVQDENTVDGWRWSDLSWDSASNITDSYYTEDDAAAKAKYDRIQSEIQAQDKKLELELDDIESQRSAVTTEIESVEKVINENIESTFNAFG